MAKISLRGDAQNISQVQTFTLTAVATSGVYTVVMNLKEIAYTATVDDTNDTAATALVALLSGSALGEFQEVTWSVEDNVITGESKEPGMPFTATVTAAGGVTFVTAITVVAKGKNFASDPDNWTLARVPAGECAAPVQSAATASTGGSLSNGVTYYWVVTATNPLGETTRSNQVSLAITNPNLTANLSWAVVVGATGYKIYRSTTTNVYTPTALLATISSGSTLTYIDTGTAVASGAVPSSNTALGDDVYLSQAATALLHGTDLNYIVWNSLTVDSTYTGDGGLPDYNAAGYYEYRNTYLKVAPKTVYYGGNSAAGGVGPGLFRVDYGSNTTSWFIYGTGTPRIAGLPALYIKGVSASSIVIQQGFVGLAANPGETANYSTLFEVGYRSSPNTDVNLIIGSGCTLANILQLGGIINSYASMTQLDNLQGSFYQKDTATITTLKVAGNYYHQTTGTITTTTVEPTGVFDHSQDVRAGILTTLTLKDGCTFKDPAHTLSYTNPIVISGSISKMNLDFGSNYSLEFA